MLGLAETGQVGVDDGGQGALMAEVDLDLAEVLALFQQVGGVRMTQRVDVGTLGDAAGFQGEAKGALEGGAAHRLRGGGCTLAAVALGGEEEPGMLMGFPELTQPEQGALRQRDVTVAIAFPAADVQEGALAIDIADLQAEALAQTQTAGVDRGQGDAMIEGFDAAQDLADLGGGEDDGEFELGSGASELEFGGPGTLEGFLPEELDGAEGLGGGLAGKTALGLEVEEVLAEFLGRDEVGGLGVVLSELAYASPVTVLRSGLEGKEAEVVGEAIQDCVGRDFFLCMGRRIKVGTGGAMGTRARRSAPSVKPGSAGANENPSRPGERRVAHPIRPAPPRSGFVQQPVKELFAGVDTP